MCSVRPALVVKSVRLWSQCGGTKAKPEQCSPGRKRSFARDGKKPGSFSGVSIWGRRLRRAVARRKRRPRERRTVCEESNPDFTLEGAHQKVEPGLRTGWLEAHLNNPSGGRVPPTSTASIQLSGECPEDRDHLRSRLRLLINLDKTTSSIGENRVAITTDTATLRARLRRRGKRACRAG
jgi:hypothetical protein